MEYNERLDIYRKLVDNDNFRNLETTNDLYKYLNTNEADWLLDNLDSDDSKKLTSRIYSAIFSKERHECPVCGTKVPYATFDSHLRSCPNCNTGVPVNIEWASGDIEFDKEIFIKKCAIMSESLSNTITKAINYYYFTAREIQAYLSLVPKFSKANTLKVVELLETQDPSMTKLTPAPKISTKKVTKKINNIKRSKPLSLNITQDVKDYLDEIDKFINSFDIKTQRNYKLGDYNLDIFIPEKNLAIVFFGLMSHSIGYSAVDDYNNYGTEKGSYLRKLGKNLADACDNNGYQLLQIFENEWVGNKELWKSVIKSKLGISKYRIYARKLKVDKNIPINEAREFLIKSHLQQDKSVGTVRYGLRDDKGILIALMTFAKPRFSKDTDWELIRFAVKEDYSVPGGASKLLKHFRKDNSGIIVSYANRRWSSLARGHNLYSKLGFELTTVAGSNYYYFIPGQWILWSRNKFQKHKLEKQLNFFDPNIGEKDNMMMNGYRMIFDAGNLVFKI